EERDRDRPPDEPEDRQERPELLALQVAVELQQRVAEHLRSFLVPFLCPWTPRQGRGGGRGHPAAGSPGTCQLICFGGRWTSWSPFFTPSRTSMFRPSEMPVLISTLRGSSFVLFPGSSTNAFFPPSSNVTSRSGIVTTSFFS